MKTLLLVDDELDNLRSLGEILKQFGFKVIEKPDAHSALTIIREGASVDLIITDYRMPGMNGLEFIVVLKQILPAVPIVMLTSYGTVETYLKSLSIGVFEFVSKPIKAKELEHIIKVAFEKAEHKASPNKLS